MFPAVSLAALCRISTASSNPALDNIVAYWKMDEAGSVPRIDATGNGHTLAVTGTVNSAAGKINNGCAFVNNAANFLSNNDAVFSGLFPFTAFCWVNFSGSIGSNQTVMGRYSAVPPNGWRISLNAAAALILEAGDGVGGGNILIGAGALGTGAWHLVIVSIDAANNGTILVDNGVLVSGAMGAVANPGVSLKVGVADMIPSPLNAIVDEAGVYNRLLTTDEKTALWNAGAGKSCCPFT